MRGTEYGVQSAKYRFGVATLYIALCTPYLVLLRPMPRYVILLHVLPPGHERATHYDLMLDAGESLRTWALAAPPSPGATLAATSLAAHRRDYLDYEGPVFGDRGTVTRWDAGEYALDSETADEIVVQLHGRRYSGVVTIRAGMATCE